MIEFFLSDRGRGCYDFEFFVFDSDSIMYITKKYDSLTPRMKKFYKSLENGTLLIDNMPINVENATDQQIEYIKNVMLSFKEKVEEYRKYYKPGFIAYSRGNTLSDIKTNNNKIELPNPRMMKEWAHIKGFEYLENFIYTIENNNCNHKGI